MSVQRVSRTALIVSLCLSLVVSLFALDSALFADGVPLDDFMFRIGFHHGANALPAVRFESAGGVAFALTDESSGVTPLLTDAGGRWQIHRQGVQLVAGPFAEHSLALEAVARWPVNSGPSFIVREQRGFVVVGGNFATPEQALEYLPGLHNVGILDVQLRGTWFLQSERLPSLVASQELIGLIVPLGIDARLFFDGAWRVAVGYATDEAALVPLREALLTIQPERVWEVASADARSMTVVSDDGRLLFVYANLPGRILRAIGGDVPMSVEGRRHRGVYEFTLDQNNRFIVVLYIHVDDYLKGVVPREMPASWHLEALKAQAVVARTYTYANRNKHAALGFDLCHLSTCCQAYGGVDWEHPQSSLAVDETRGVIALFNGRPSSTFYHSDSGGHTENSENVWSRAFPYLVGVPDIYGALAGSPHSRWQREITQAEMQQIARRNGGDVGEVLNVFVQNRFASGRVSILVIQGTTGRLTLTRQQPRLPDGSAGLFALRSTMYTVASRGVEVTVRGAQTTTNLNNLQGAFVASASGVQSLPAVAGHVLRGANGTRTTNSVPTSFVFEGSGWGHGVGMSQWGARGMAEAGHQFRAILAHYYREVLLADVPY